MDKTDERIEALEKRIKQLEGQSLNALDQPRLEGMWLKRMYRRVQVLEGSVSTTLGDNAGVNTFSVRDSDNVVVFSVNSDGAVSFTTLTVTTINATTGNITTVNSTTVNASVGNITTITATTVNSAFINVQGATSGLRIYHRDSPTRYFELYATGNVLRFYSSLGAADVLLIATGGAVTFPGTITAQLGMNVTGLAGFADNINVDGTATFDGPVIVTGAISETALGQDNVRFGVLTGPRIILEDAGSTQWEIDNVAGVLQIYNPSDGKFEFNTAGRFTMLDPGTLWTTSSWGNPILLNNNTTAIRWVASGDGKRGGFGHTTNEFRWITSTAGDDSAAAVNLLTLDHDAVMKFPTSGYILESVPRGFWVRRTTAQTISTVTETSISFGSEVNDNGNFFAIGTPTIITIPSGMGGQYLLTGHVEWDTAPGAAMDIWVGIYSSAVGYIGKQHDRIVTTVGPQSVAAIAFATAGTTFALVVWHNRSASSHNVSPQSYWSAEFRGVRLA